MSPDQRIRNIADCAMAVSHYGLALVYGEDESFSKSLETLLPLYTHSNTMNSIPPTIMHVRISDEAQIRELFRQFIPILSKTKGEKVISLNIPLDVPDEKYHNIHPDDEKERETKIATTMTDIFRLIYQYRVGCWDIKVIPQTKVGKQPFIDIENGSAHILFLALYRECTDICIHTPNQCERFDQSCYISCMTITTKQYVLSERSLRNTGWTDRFVDNKLLNSVVYGIYNVTTDELLYIGSTCHMTIREKQHRSALRKGQKSRVYDYLRTNNITWALRTIEVYPCVHVGHLLFREYELIEECRPWYNEIRLRLRKCSSGCGRILKFGSTCRVCETIQTQKTHNSRFRKVQIVPYL